MYNYYSKMALLSVAVVLLVCSIGHILAQECPDGITTKLVTGDISLDLQLTVPACIRCGYIVGFNLVHPTDVTWRRSRAGSIIALTNHTRGVLIDPNTTTLILNNPGDVIIVADELRCYSAKAQKDGHSTGEHIITILAFNFLNPLLSPNDSTVSVVEGSNLILSCDDPGNSGSTSYQWFSVNGSELSNRETTPPALLTFNNIQRISSGVYICRSSKTNIDMIRESNVTINVQYPPITSITTSYDGSVFIINCTFDGNPPPSVTWLHNGAPLNINQLTINTQSTYSELIMNINYSGTYVCTANNTIGHDTSNPITISGISISPGSSTTTIYTTTTTPMPPSTDLSPAVISVSTVVGALVMLLVSAILIMIVIYFYYSKNKKTNRDEVFVDNIDTVDLQYMESSDYIDKESTPDKNIPFRSNISSAPYEDLTFPGDAATEEPISTPAMRSDRMIYAELANFPSANKETQDINNNKPVTNETIVYSELSVAQRQPQPSHEKALYADIGHFTPNNINRPQPSNVDKVVYSGLDSLSIRRVSYV